MIVTSADPKHSRNVKVNLSAGWGVGLADLGPDALLEEIGRRADVSIRTLYNHFPAKSDLVPADLRRIMAMPTSTLWTMAPGDGWRRYLALMFEGLTPAAANPLPASVALLKQPPTGGWPL